MKGTSTRSGSAAISKDLQKYFDSPAFYTVISNTVVIALQLETVQLLMQRYNRWLLISVKELMRLKVWRNL